MKLELKRKVLTDSSTLGDLYVDGTWECHTLEDAVRSHKIERCTAIPTGTFTVTLETWEARASTYPLGPSFPPLYPLLHDVPGFTGVFIHCGNRPTILRSDGSILDGDSHGCILLGQSNGPDIIYQSRAAFIALLPKIKAAIARGEEVLLTIS